MKQANFINLNLVNDSDGFFSWSQRTGHNSISDAFVMETFDQATARLIKSLFV